MNSQLAEYNEKNEHWQKLRNITVCVNAELVRSACTVFNSWAISFIDTTDDDQLDLGETTRDVRTII